MEHLIYGTVLAGFVLALWDGARRYFAQAEFNQREIERIVRLEFDQAKLRETVDNLGAKLNATQAAQATRSPVRGLR